METTIQGPGGLPRRGLIDAFLIILTSAGYVSGDLFSFALATCSTLCSCYSSSYANCLDGAMD